MISAWRVFRNETAKMGRLKMIYLGPLCILAVSFVFMLNLQRMFGGPSRNAWAMLVQTAKLNVTLIIPIFMLVYTSSLISGEKDRGSIRLTLTRPVSRCSFLIGKLLSSWLYIIVLLISVAIFGAIVGAGFGAFGPIVDFDDLIWTSWQACWQIAACFALTAIPLFAVAVGALLISVLSRSLLAAISFAVGGWSTLILLQEYLVGLKYFGWVDAADLLITRNLDIALRVAESVASGSVAPWDQPGLILTLSASLVWILVLFGACLVIFARQDLNQH